MFTTITNILGNLHWAANKVQKKAILKHLQGAGRNNFKTGAGFDFLDWQLFHCKEPSSRKRSHAALLYWSAPKSDQAACDQECAAQLAGQTGLTESCITRLITKINGHACVDATEQQPLVYERLIQIAESDSTSPRMLDLLANCDHVGLKTAIADNPVTTADTLKRLIGEDNLDLRYAIAENHNVPPEVLELLIRDENPFVAQRARKTLDRLQGGQLLQGNFGIAQESERKAKEFA